MSCPYAAPLSKDEASSATSSPNAGPINASDDPEVQEALKLARSACPAFQDGKGCPFRDATDAEAMRLAMLKVPPSHIIGVAGNGAGNGTMASTAGGDGSSGSKNAGTAGDDVSAKFRKALEHVHTVSTSLHSPNASANAPNGKNAGSAAGPASPFGGFMLEGGCPFKTFYKGDKTSNSSVPFVSAMEDFSLSAIIARMADEADSREGTGAADAHNIDDKWASAIAGKVKSAEPATSTPAATTKSATATADSVEQPVSISKALQTGTAESHEAAESVHFVKNFVKGIIDRDLYASLVVSLYHVYNVMEEELENHGPTHFPALHHPTELNRTASLEDDAEFFHGMGWEKTPVGTPSAATVDYIERLRFIAKKEPLLLLSHAYTRYLGDLSGGRILARVARRALNLKGSKDGLRFYEFELIDNAKKFKDAYRRALDDLKLSPDQVHRLVAEANVAFVLNMRVFEELDVKGGVKGVKVRPLAEATKYYDSCVAEQKRGRRGSGSITSSGGDAKCPFAYLSGPNPHGNKIASGTPAAEAAKPTPTQLASAVRGPVKSTEEEESKSHDEKGGRCPWPFVFCHDPVQGMKDWQTWLVIGLALSWLWSKIQAA